MRFGVNVSHAESGQFRALAAEKAPSIPATACRRDEKPTINPQHPAETTDHLCLGARLEATVALEVLTERIPSLTLIEGPSLQRFRKQVVGHPANPFAIRREMKRLGIVRVLGPGHKLKWSVHGEVLDESAHCARGPLIYVADARRVP